MPEYRTIPTPINNQQRYGARLALEFDFDHCSHFTLAIAGRGEYRVSLDDNGVEVHRAGSTFRHAMVSLFACWRVHASGAHEALDISQGCRALHQAVGNERLEQLAGLEEAIGGSQSTTDIDDALTQITGMESLWDTVAQSPGGHVQRYVENIVKAALANRLKLVVEAIETCGTHAQVDELTARQIESAKQWLDGEQQTDAQVQIVLNGVLPEYELGVQDAVARRKTQLTPERQIDNILCRYDQATRAANDAWNCLPEPKLHDSLLKQENQIFLTAQSAVLDLLANDIELSAWFKTGVFCVTKTS